jgi:hypothetical protein
MAASVNPVGGSSGRSSSNVDVHCGCAARVPVSSRQNAMAKGVGEDSIETRGECVSL